MGRMGAAASPFGAPFASWCPHHASSSATKPSRALHSRSPQPHTVPPMAHRHGIARPFGPLRPLGGCQPFVSRVAHSLAAVSPACHQPALIPNRSPLPPPLLPRPQDYSPHALAAFRSWLRSQVASLDALNVRWRSTFASWVAVEPPQLQAGAYVGVDLSPR